MIFDAPTRYWLIALICTAPALLRWWWGRALVRQADDPVLPERLLANNRRNLIVVISAAVGLAAVGPLHSLLWSLPLLLLLRIAGGFPLRRALYQERWTLGGYLGFLARLVGTTYGFWILLAAVPALARMAEPLDAVAAIVLSILLLLWNEGFPSIIKRALGSRPLTDPLLLGRFNAIADRSRAARPSFEVVDLRGGEIANALALPSRRRSAVLYTDTLLRILNADEAAAITAHELAHLEYYDSARLRWLKRVTVTLILSGAASIPAASQAGLSILPHQILWSVVVLATLAWIGRDRQANETASDLRAAELTGDHEALVTGLTKLYLFARIPRRWDSQMESSASHPSLARRIRAIRAGSSGPATALDAPMTIHGRGSAAVVFERDRLQWREQEGIAHLLSYAHLNELRVHANATGATKLVAVERGGRRWELKLDAAEASRVQSILDAVDARLSDPPAAQHGQHLVLLAASVAALCAVWLGQLAAAVLALSACVQRGRALAAAAAAAAVCAVVLIASNAPLDGADSFWPMAGLVVASVGLTIGALWSREESGSVRARLVFGALSVCAAASVAVVLARGDNAVRLYQASQELPAATVLPLALAAAMCLATRRAVRVAAAPVAAAGLAVAAIGTQTFLYAVGTDPFLVGGGASLIIETLGGPTLADVTLDVQGLDLRVSPGGRYLAVKTSDDWQRRTGEFRVGRPGGPFGSIEATDLRFVDDGRAVVSVARGYDTVVRGVNVDTLATVWEETFEDLAASQLVLDPATGRWHVTGLDYSGTMRLVIGGPDGRVLRQQQWPDPAGAGWTEATAIDGDAALVATQSFGLEELPAAWTWATVFQLGQTRTVLKRAARESVSTVSSSDLPSSCSTDPRRPARLVCAAFDGRRTHFIAAGVSGGALTSLGVVPGQFLSDQPSRGEWTTGRLAGGAAAVDPETRRVIAGPRDCRTDAITVAGNTVGLLEVAGASTRVRLHRLPAVIP